MVNESDCAICILGLSAHRVCEEQQWDNYHHCPPPEDLGAMTLSSKRELSENGETSILQKQD